MNQAKMCECNRGNIKRIEFEQECSDDVVLTYISLSQTTEYILPNSIGIALHNFLHVRSSSPSHSFFIFIFLSSHLCLFGVLYVTLES